ncbi:hypothetical protein HUB94_28560 (plasmid) [Paenibacillus cellulosilyticus]|nr:hypothetical protein HUB94_28560 [Paenibacillus cellulosilyticus]
MSHEHSPSQRNNAYNEQPSGGYCRWWAVHFLWCGIALVSANLFTGICAESLGTPFLFD